MFIIFLNFVHFFLNNVHFFLERRSYKCYPNVMNDVQIKKLLISGGSKMWDLTILSHFTDDEMAPAGGADFTTIRSIKTCYADTLMIRTGIANALAHEEKRLRSAGNASDYHINRLKREIQNLTACLDKVDVYLKKLEGFREIEELLADSAQKNINPRHRIIWGGRTLQAAADQMNAFLSQPDPLQEFDRVYE